MPKMQRDKGKVGERKLATEIREAFPELAGLIRRGWQSRQSDDECDVTGMPGVWFESKFGKKPNARAALAQAIEESEAAVAAGKRGRAMPIAVIRDNRKDPFVCMRLDDFFVLLRSQLAAEGWLPHGRNDAPSGEPQEGQRKRRRKRPSAHRVHASRRAQAVAQESEGA